MIYKSVGFAYPTSIDAKRFNRYKTGCWVVELRKAGEGGESISAFDTKQEAIAFAEKMDQAWCPFYLCAEAALQKR